MQSGYRSSDRIYYSKRSPVRIPDSPGLDVTSFLFAPEFGDRKALVDAPTGRSLTYTLLERDVRALAAGLYSELGVRQYDVVMLLSLSCIEFPVTFLAVLSLGAVVTTANPVNTAAEIRKQMKDSGTLAHSDSDYLSSHFLTMDHHVDIVFLITFRCDVTHFKFHHSFESLTVFRGLTSDRMSSCQPDTSYSLKIL